MSIEIITAAYETKLGNSFAKTILVLLADQAGPDGYGATSIRLLHDKAEISTSTIWCHIRVFEEIGLLERVQSCDPPVGSPLKVAFQFSLEKLGTDLRKEFTVALSRLSALVSPVTLICP